MLYSTTYLPVLSTEFCYRVPRGPRGFCHICMAVPVLLLPTTLATVTWIVSPGGIIRGSTSRASFFVLTYTRDMSFTSNSPKFWPVLGYDDLHFRFTGKSPAGSSLFVFLEFIPAHWQWLLQRSSSTTTVSDHLYRKLVQACSIVVSRSSFHSWSMFCDLSKTVNSTILLLHSRWNWYGWGIQTNVLIFWFVLTLGSANAGS
jgi:hypothetical protein